MPSPLSQKARLPSTSRTIGPKPATKLALIGSPSPHFLTIAAAVMHPMHRISPEGSLRRRLMRVLHRTAPLGAFARDPMHTVHGASPEGSCRRPSMRVVHQTAPLGASRRDSMHTCIKPAALMSPQCQPSIAARDADLR